MARTNEPQGCLTVILRLFGIDLTRAATTVDARPQGTEPALDQIPDEATSSVAIAGPLPYRTRHDFLSAAEFSFYRVLCSAVGGNGVVCPKINLNDIFFVPRSPDEQKFRNKIDRKHVDFLVCNPQTMKPLCGIELDDGSHAKPDRQDRDRFVQGVFDAAGLRLLRFPVRKAYSISELAEQILPALEVQPESHAEQAQNDDGPPTCRKCGVPMVRRTASKGANAGNEFWGCPNYPKCREIC